MPQQRRKVPFSGKKKKEQIVQKRQKVPTKSLRSQQESYEDSDVPETTARKLMEQPFSRGGRNNKNVNRYNLQFFQETKKSLEEIKLEGFKPLELATSKEREVDEKYFANGYEFPKRPKWSNGMSKYTLECNEQRYFREYVDNLLKLNANSELSLFELNLETWRQLWRVLEMSDILLIIVDVRFAAMMFSPGLYNYIVNDLKKHAILVLNKVDLVQPEAVVAWIHYFRQRYPELPVVLFASFPAKQFKGTQRGRRAHKRSMDGVYNIFRECQKIVDGAVDLAPWEEKILEDMRVENINIFEENHDEVKSGTAETTIISNFVDASPEEHERYRDGALTIGCIGYPNVGKSSLINALKGRKVVSVSRTPGHTKHFQTIFLTKKVRLCDCPGLVFPSTTPKPLQVLMGSYPISQLQVPYRALKFLGEHLNLPQLLRIHLPEDYDEWSAVAIADAWAIKRGFLTAKAARPDRYRAANHILRMCLAGQQQLVLQFYPLHYESMKDKWLNHPEIAEVKKYQNIDLETDENDDTSSVCSDTPDSDNVSASISSNDETNADDDELTGAHCSQKSRNTFALLEDD